MEARRVSDAESDEESDTDSAGRGDNNLNPLQSMIPAMPNDIAQIFKLKSIQRCTSMSGCQSNSPSSTLWSEALENLIFIKYSD
ncbi:hypothetical protein Pst134EA_017583 [Puccinia striiformis f. sp. tritici]|uniref:hypothetical protein n=1 Tax=Puccinia striiformis f. sp. tritici TaxID=168172 RepID=UPI0020081A1E|nr:hypothetical protein Pst134EA_017583 [Puccinia striiformis f. sp. tritici]KAH9461276.1 hypothetical protein Pst134EA_017583 [Puccinia striiformis f. sp. tritici]